MFEILKMKCFQLLLRILAVAAVWWAQSQPAKLDLNKKSFPKQKTIQNFTIDAQGFRKKQDWKAFQPSRRREKNDKQDMLEIWQNLDQYLLSLTIYTIPNDNLDNPKQQFWQSSTSLLTIPNNNYNNT